MIRVLYILDVLDVVGGTERQLRELIRHMDRSRFEPAVVTLYRTGMPHEDEFGGIGCPMHCLGIRRLMSAGGVRAVAKLASRIRRQRIDIVHTFFPDAGIVGTLAGRLGGARVVIGRRDLGYWHSTKYLALLRRLQRFADLYVVNSEAVRAVVAEAESVDNSRIQVVRNGHFARPAPPETWSLGALGFAPDTKLIGIVANLRPVKRLDRFIEVAAGIRDPRAAFLIVGYGELHDSLIEQARRAGLGDRLRITHTIEGVSSLLRLFRAGVLTSESEGLSNTLIEYGFAGVPAVGFDVGGNREVINHGDTGFLVKPYDVSAMRDRIEELLADEDLCSRMGSRARAICTTRFDGEAMVNGTQTIYKKLAAARS